MAKTQYYNININNNIARSESVGAVRVQNNMYYYFCLIGTQYHILFVQQVFISPYFGIIIMKEMHDLIDLKIKCFHFMCRIVISDTFI